RRVVVPTHERPGGVVEPGPGEPIRPGQAAFGQDPVVGAGRADLEVVPDRGPEALQVGDRPAPELLVVAEAKVSRLRQPVQVPGQVAAPPLLLGRSPHDLGCHVIDCGIPSALEGRGSPRRYRSSGETEVVARQENLGATSARSALGALPCRAPQPGTSAQSRSSRPSQRRSRLSTLPQSTPSRSTSCRSRTYRPSSSPPISRSRPP